MKMGISDYQAPFLPAPAEVNGCPLSCSSSRTLRQSRVPLLKSLQWLWWWWGAFEILCKDMHIYDKDLYVLNNTFGTKIFNLHVSENVSSYDKVKNYTNHKICF